MLENNICKMRTLDSVWTELNNFAADNLRNLLSYEYDLWIPSRFGKRKKRVKKYLIDSFGRDSNHMLTGYVDRCLNFLDKYDIPYEYSSDVPVMEFDDPSIDGITFRPYQDKLINSALKAGRGVIKSPTGSGKSIIILGIMSAFSQENILFLVHTTDLVYQMKADLDKFGFPCGVWTGKDKFLDRITVATVQSYKKIARKHTSDWDVVFVDEGHHVTQVTKGNYFDALAMTGAPCKFALTATLSEKIEAQWALEGLIGPLIDELTMAEGTDLGFLAVPEIIMYPVESPIEIWGKKEWKKSYDVGIVKNSNRNIRIACEAEKEMDKGGTVLILVTRISQADELQKLIERRTEIVKGAVSKEERGKIKKDIKSGKLGCVIATTAWVEGVDIPSLSCVINAGGGKSEREVLQKIGRGLRKAENKSTVLIIDFEDIGNKHLEKHSLLRKGIYEEQGWKVK